MKREFENKITDVKKAEHTRRTELAMLYLLIDKYPLQVREKIRKPINESNSKKKTASL